MGKLPMLRKIVLGLVVSFVLSSCTDKVEKIDRRSSPQPEKTGEGKKSFDPLSKQGQGQGQDQGQGQIPNSGPSGKEDDTSGVQIFPVKRSDQEIKQGQLLYENKCASCHSGLKKGDIAKINQGCTHCSNIDDFVRYLPGAMPKNAVGSCDQQCARLIGFYLFP